VAFRGAGSPLTVAGAAADFGPPSPGTVFPFHPARWGGNPDRGKSWNAPGKSRSVRARAGLQIQVTRTMSRGWRRGSGVPSGDLASGLDGALVPGGADEVEGEVADGGHVARAPWPLRRRDRSSAKVTSRTKVAAGSRLPVTRGSPRRHRRGRREETKSRVSEPVARPGSRRGRGRRFRAGAARPGSGGRCRASRCRGGRRCGVPDLQAIPRQSSLARQPNYAAGSMFWLRCRAFSGSHSALSAARRR
jgi:hypothetical protein